MGASARVARLPELPGGFVSRGPEGLLKASDRRPFSAGPPGARELPERCASGRRLRPQCPAGPGPAGPRGQPAPTHLQGGVARKLLDERSPHWSRSSGVFRAFRVPRRRLPPLWPAAASPRLAIPGPASGWLARGRGNRHPPTPRATAGAGRRSASCGWETIAEQRHRLGGAAARLRIARWPSSASGRPKGRPGHFQGRER